jgi:hypothetical protein
MHDVQPPETREFEKIIYDNFEHVSQQGMFELRRRRDGIDANVCTNIVE